MTDRKYDRIGYALAVLLHGALLLLLLFSPPFVPRRRTLIEVDIQKKPPPVTLPPPERKIVEKKEPPKPAQAPPPQKAQKTPPKPVVPVFGLSDVPEKGTGISVPLGNTTLADPNAPRHPVEPLPPAAGVPGGKEYHPVSEEDLKAPPAHDIDACTAGLKEKYQTSDAFAEGIEGDVVLRVELDEQGKVRSIRKVKGIGHGIDEMALGWVRFNPKCRFGPAIAKDGKPAAYVIDRYTIHFEIAR